MVTLGKGICVFFGVAGSCYSLWLLWDCWRQTQSHATPPGASNTPPPRSTVNGRADWWCQLAFATVALWCAVALVMASKGELLSLVWQPERTPCRIARDPGVASVSADLGVDVYFDISHTDRSTTGIDCAHSHISDKQVADLLHNAPKLQWLILSGTPITGSVLEEVKHTPTLRGLSLACPQITDEDLEHLKPLTELHVLDLANTQVTDDGLTHLHTLANLRLVDLTNTSVTEKGVAELLQVLPDCSVER